MHCSVPSAFFVSGAGVRVGGCIYRVTWTAVTLEIKSELNKPRMFT